MVALLIAIAALSFCLIIVRSLSGSRRVGLLDWYLQDFTGIEDRPAARQPQAAAPQPKPQLSLQEAQPIPRQASMPSSQPAISVPLVNNQFKVMCAIGNSQQFEALIDTGAMTCCISEGLAKRLKMPLRNLGRGRSTGVGGYTVETRVGEMDWIIGGKLVARGCRTSVVMGADASATPLLGMVALKQFRTSTDDTGHNYLIFKKA